MTCEKIGQDEEKKQVKIGNFDSLKDLVGKKRSCSSLRSSV
jgi:hypothetical protein